MVYKVSKGGVRTGNTLRGLNSARTKRYGRHACLVGSTNLGRRDLSRLVSDSSHYGQMVEDALSKTDVLLSLNKQQRWRLPAIMGHMIKQGEFHKGATVSMLERHKLKRRANCVGLVSNSSRNSGIAPRDKRYFSYSLDSVASDQSQRKKRKEKAEQLLKRRKETIDKDINLKKLYYKAIEAYTADGNNDSVGTILDADRPEYRLEVFYPCPETCSLKYNPKYTDVTVAEGPSGKMEVRSNVKVPKKGLSTHRKRLTLRDINDFCYEEEGDCADEMWRECSDDYDKEHEAVRSERIADERTFASFLAQAEKARDLFIHKNKFTDNKKKKKSRHRSHEDTEHNKSHIVYIDGEGQESQVIVPNKDEMIDVTATSTPDATMVYSRVILPASEVSPEELRRTYGSFYVEASCQPRRFVLDVTEDVSSLLSTTKVTGVYNLSSFLVFVFDGFYDDGLEAFKVTLNSMVGTDSDCMSQSIPFAITSIPEILNRVASHLLDMREQDKLEYKEWSGKEYKKDSVDFLTSRIKLLVKVFDPSKAITQAIVKGRGEKEFQSMNSSHLNNALTTCLDEGLFCDVCYANITPSRLDSVCGTRLQPCGHLLCDECWASHFRSCMREGRTVMSCGGYDCNTTVETATLLSILSVFVVATLLQRQAEEKVETMKNAKWCPNPDCGSVIVVDSKWNDLCVDVICACGKQLCFSCFGPAHWPAKCDQAEEYLDLLPSIKPTKEYVEEEEKRVATPLPPKKKKEPTAMMVEGRLCPRCTKFIEKNGGCPHMVCKCGYAMCWTCMESYSHSQCKPDPAWLYKHTRILIVRHSAPNQTLTDEVTQPPKIVRNRQRASLYQRAAQQREEKTSSDKYSRASTRPLVTKIVRTANNDTQFKMEILRAFQEECPSAEDVTAIQKIDVTRRVDSLFDASIKMKRELHRITEFTFILIQGTPNSLVKQRILKLANDLRGFCSFVGSILDLQDNQDVKAAVRRLVDLHKWAERALDALVGASHSMRTQ